MTGLQVQRRRDSNVVVSPKHIVVAHCNEDISWLNQLYAYEREMRGAHVCENVHVHLYSKCGMDLDVAETLPDLMRCTTLHRIRNCGVANYAYFRYIADLYDSLPPMVAFIQAGTVCYR